MLISSPAALTGILPLRKVSNPFTFERVILARPALGARRKRRRGIPCQGPFVAISGPKAPTHGNSRPIGQELGRSFRNTAWIRWQFSFRRRD